MKKALYYAKAIVAGLGAAGVAVVTYAPNADNEVGLILGLAGAVVVGIGVAAKGNGRKPRG
jgi:drug/metabolite transporter (DMT)-like permease